MNLKISQKILFSLLGVAILSVVVFSLLMSYSTAEVLRRNITREIRKLAEESAMNLEELVHRSRTTVLITAKSPEITGLLDCLKKGACEDIERTLELVETEFLNLQRLDRAVQAVRFINVSGYVLAKVKEGKIIPRNGPAVKDLGLKAVSIKRDRGFFRNTMELKESEVWISNLERGWMEGAKEWCPAMVRFSTPLFFSDGTRAGIVIINIWGQIAGERINRLLQPGEGSAFLVERNLKDPNRNGIYLFHQKSQCEFGNQTGTHITVFDQYPTSVTDAWMHSDEGIGINPKTRDILFHRFFSPYRDRERGWVLVVNARRGFFMAPLSAIRKRILYFGGLVLLVTLFAAFLFSRSLTRPIREVVEGARNIGKDLGNRISVRSGGEIGVLAREINQMASSLEKSLEEKKRVEERIFQSEKLASIGEMASGLAHELNTPLGNIRALSVLAMRDMESGRTDEDAMKNDLTDILEQVNRCSRIISGLLSFARPQAPQYCFADLNDLLNDTLHLIRIKSNAKKIRISLEKNDYIPRVMIDAHQIQQVFVNILMNALDAVEEGGRISITSAVAGGNIRVRFEDNGCGIGPGIVPRIFDPFFTTKEVGKGTGLGLSVSYGILKNHGGTIEVESAPGKGAVFTVVLPAGDHKDDKNIGS